MTDHDRPTAAAVKWRRTEGRQEWTTEPVEHPAYGPVVAVVTDNGRAGHACLRRAEMTDHERAAVAAAEARGDWLGYRGPHGELIGDLEPALVDGNEWLGAHQTTRWHYAADAQRAATAWLTGQPSIKGGPNGDQRLGVRLCLVGEPSAAQIAADATGQLAARRARLDADQMAAAADAALDHDLRGQQ